MDNELQFYLAQMIEMIKETTRERLENADRAKKQVNSDMIHYLDGQHDALQNILRYVQERSALEQTRGPIQ